MKGDFTMKPIKDERVISSLLDNIKDEELLLNHPIQRKPGQFTPAQKSLLIDSLLRNYPIPPIYTVVEGKKEYVIDGLQRLSIIASYVNDEFALTSKLKPLSYEDGGETVELELQKLKFSKLPKKLQKRILKQNLSFISFHDCKEGELNEVFLRLNNGVPLNKPQKLHAILSSQMQTAIKDIIELDFFTKTIGLTKTTRIKSHDESMVIQTLMLLNDNMDFSKKGMPAFLESYTYNQEDFDLIKNAVVELGEKFPKKTPNFIKSIVPMVIYALIKCPEKKKHTYFNALSLFVANYDKLDTYNNIREHCNSGTISPTNVAWRVDYFLGLYNKSK